MNWFQRFFTNPNVHSILAAVANVAQPVAFSTGHPEVALAIAAVGTLTGVVSAATPENPVLVPTAQPAMPVPGLPTGGPIVHLPPAASGGSYHANDWLILATQLMQQFAPPPAAPAPAVAPTP